VNDEDIDFSGLCDPITDAEYGKLYEQAYYVECLDAIRLNALGMASSYAAHMEGGQEPEEVARRANVYLDFLLGKPSGTVQ